MNILITGGAGFIGSHTVRHFVDRYPDSHIVNLDVLTYAGNLQNLKDIENAPNYTFIRGNIRDEALIKDIFKEYQITHVIHLAAESHVDRSIGDPMLFLYTNIIGTAVLLQVAKKYWENDYSGKLFYHVSTDEVYGSLGQDSGLFTEVTPYDPRSPYSASKASSDHLVRAYHHTYGMPVVISNCSNNYGPYQFPEKLIPLMIHNILHKKELPVYGKGENVRDWLYVEDHVRAIDTVLQKGLSGQTYNIGGHNEWKNLDIVHLVCDIMDSKLGRKAGESRNLISFVQDRPGHDLRYAIDASKIENELKWTPESTFETGIVKTIDWYLDNQEWLKAVTSGVYKTYYDRQYNTGRKGKLTE
ncbi:MAG TPA: dTDP-glucose 4,6-dehydratase [Saprospiraceae bacterium]|jgi:dTDP-glucose 4,6-dehydratase|nr:dTDP-glucose 4,6-dehydratase [Saprospiraceae bacterium]HRP41918.1 dTDP-glucose 4,6-dehydratase [Saprospiraceae bacterium]